jgi:hypothetical protein
MDNLHKIRLAVGDLVDEFIQRYYPSYDNYYWIGDDDFGMLDVGDDIFWGFEDILRIMEHKPKQKDLDYFYEYITYIENPSVTLLKFLLEGDKWKPVMKAEIKLKDELSKLKPKSQANSPEWLWN